MFRLALACAVALLVPAQSTPTVPNAAPADRRAAVQAHLDTWRAASGVPGVTLGVVLRDGTTWALASGESDTSTHRAMQPTDLMLAGSTGKTLFAAVAVQLIEAGTLDLDAKISKYLGNRPWLSRLPNGADATVRQLMTHTSGIVRYEFDPKFTADLRAQPAKVWQREEQLAYLFDQRAPFAAGQGWEYSDTNYIVLGLIVEQLTGTSYYDLIRQRFLGPLGLRGLVPSDSRRIPGLANGYVGAGDPILPAGPVVVDGSVVVNPQVEWAGGGFATNAGDLARWGHELYAGRALSARARRLMIDAAVPAKLGAASSYGLGVIVRAPSAAMPSTTWGHSGYFPGYMSELIHVVDDGTTLAIQINSSGPRARGTASPLRVLYDVAAMLK